MLKFRDSADPHSKTIVNANGRLMGFVQWHPERNPRLVLNGADSLDLEELNQCVDEIEKHATDK